LFDTSMRILVFILQYYVIIIINMIETKGESLKRRFHSIERIYAIIKEACIDFIYFFISIYLYKHIYTYIYIYLCMYVCVYTWNIILYINIHVHIHTHTYIYIYI